MLHAVFVLLFLGCMAAAAFTDLFEMKIPNVIPALLCLGFLAACFFAGLSLAGFGMHVVAGLVVFFACFALFAINVMGGGDAKLLAAAAFWYGFNMVLVEFLIDVALLGGLLTLVILLIRSQADVLMALGLRLPASILNARKIPYGPAIACAGFISITQSPLAASLLAM